MVELGTLRFMPPGPREAEGVGEEAPLGGRRGGQWPLEGKEAKDLTKQFAHPTHMQICVHQNTCAHVSIQHLSEEPQAGNSTVAHQLENGYVDCGVFTQWNPTQREPRATNVTTRKTQTPIRTHSVVPFISAGLNWE